MQVLVLFALFSTTHLFALETLSLGTSPYRNLWEAAEVFVDKSASMPFSEIKNAPFQEITEKTKFPNYGFTPNAVWMRFSLRTPPAGNQMVFVLDHIYLNHLSLYTVVGSEIIDQQTLGLSHPLGPEEIEYYGYAVPIRAPATSNIQLYLRAKSNYPVVLPVQVFERGSFFERLREMERIFWFYIGVISLLAITNAFFYFSVRDRTYLYYVATLLALHVFSNLTQYGVIRAHLFPDWTWFHANVFYFCHFVGIFAMFLFVRRFLAIPFKYPVLNKWLNILLFNNFALFLTGLILDKHWVDTYCQLNTSLIILSLLWLGILGISRGDRQAKFFTAAWSFLLGAWLINFFRIDGFIPHNLLTNHMILFGTMIEGAILSFALADRLRQTQLAREVAERQAIQAQTRNELAKQVAHDIRSPLAALDMAITDVSELPERKRLLIRNAATRIKDIANDLTAIDHQERFPPGIHTTLLSSLVELILTEKRSQYKKKHRVELKSSLGNEAYGVFVKVDSSKFKRIFSNLIDNAVEAINGAGSVHIYLKSQENQAILTIVDSGKGIPENVLKDLGHKQITFEKNGRGSGLGVYDAKKTLNEWRGDLEFQSQVGEGTEVTLKLPREKAPSWFVPELVINSSKRLVIVDDDKAIHQLWKNRLAPYSDLQLFHFFEIGKFSQWYQTQKDPLESLQVLTDFEFLKENDNGLNHVMALRAQKISVLVTSHFEERSIQKRCQRHGIKILPKELASIIPISIHQGKLNADLILIDDDELVHEMWRSDARRLGKDIHTFDSFEKFWSLRSNYDKDIALFIDSNLGDGLKGENVAKKLFDEGFSQIYLTTGYSQEHLGNYPWIRNIFDKQFPEHLF